jgi:hypothetical protein
MAFFEENNLPSDMFYKRKLLKDIQMDDEGLYLVGKAEEKNPSEEFVLNDGSGTIQVREIPEETEKIQEGKLYKVLGRNSIDGVGTRYLAADHVISMDDLDLELYKKALNMKKEID